MTDLTGKTIAITGGSRGLGLEMARTALAHGAAVALIGRTRATLEEAAGKLSAEAGTPLGKASRISTHVADVADDAQVRDAFAEIIDHHGRLDGLVNNAGIAEEYAFLETPAASWRRVLEINLTAPFTCMQHAARAMGPGSVIVNIASVDAHGADGPYASYVAAKTGLLGLTRAAAVELGPLGIRVVSVSPGWTLTDMAAESVTPEMLHSMRTNFKRTPLGRMNTSNEIANTVLFLLSDLASGITGEDILVDAGTRANLYILESLETGTPSEEGSTP